jgi:hypothetical protein
MAGTPDERSVFLNVPYDAGYERHFVALISILISLGRKPRCVLELAERGQGRLSRILSHLEACRISIHDLSRAGVPVRFNLPFELGLACAISARQGNHDIVILDKVPDRLDRTLSDIKGRDPHVHEGKPRVLISCILDALGNVDGDPDPGEVYELWKNLWALALKLKTRYRRKLIFHRAIFFELVAAATDLACEAGFIAP